MAQKKAPRGGPARKNGRRAAVAPEKPAPPPPLPPFRLGVVPGTTPGKWIRHWREQRPHQRLELVPIDQADQRAALAEGLVDAAICRRPIAGDLFIVALYDEVPVVVMSADSSLAAVDELSPADLEGEVLITPDDDVLGPLDLPTVAPQFPAVATTEDAIATAASGIGIVVVPMSLARLHHRKDATYRPLADGPVSEVVVAWPRERDGEDVQAFVAITRGRTARSSR